MFSARASWVSGGFAELFLGGAFVSLVSNEKRDG